MINGESLVHSFLPSHDLCGSVFWVSWGLQPASHDPHVPGSDLAGVKQAWKITSVGLWRVFDYCLTRLSCYSRNIQNLKVIGCILMFENDLSVSLRDGRSQKPWNMDRKSARVQKQTLKGHTKTLHSFTVGSVVGKSFWNWNLNRNTNTDGCTFD